VSACVSVSACVRANVCKCVCVSVSVCVCVCVCVCVLEFVGDNGAHLSRSDFCQLLFIFQTYPCVLQSSNL
jgi:hypothetical protein